MNRTMRWSLLSLALLLSPLCAREANAQTINAASCNENDVAAALASVKADGTTVVIPKGNCTWTTTLSYTQTNSFTLQGTGAITPAGGSDNTIIQDNVNYSSNSDSAGMLNITTLAGKSFRMTGIAFYWVASNGTQPFNGEIRIGGYSQAVRIDHNHFYQPSGTINGICIMTISGWEYGVADQNQWDLVGPDVNGIRVQHQAWNNESPAIANNSWAAATRFGSGNFFFMEDNAFNWLGPTNNPAADFGAVDDCSAGGRIVFRHNTINGLLYFQTHEMEGDFRGCRAIEVYDNTATASTSPATLTFSFFLQTRMGTGLVWGNTLTGYQQVLNMSNDRTQTGSGAHVMPPMASGWGMCGISAASAAGQTPSPWDQKPLSANGYACIDQVGRGASQLLSGEFLPYGTGKINAVTGIASWPNNALEPYYAWENTFNAPPSANGYATSGDSIGIVENRDYYLQLPNYRESATFSGTAGIGQGSLSARPSNCTPFVAYWATDTNTLYQCAAPNTWATYYTPYTYPHPLTSGSQSSGPPAAPSNLAATVSN